MSPDSITKQRFDYHAKSKIATAFTIFTLSFYVLSLFLMIVVLQITDFGNRAVDYQAMPYSAWSTFFSNLLSGIVCFFLIFKLLKYHKIQPTIIKILFMAYLFFSSFPALIVAVNTVIPPNDLDLENFFSLASFFLIPGSTFFLVYFVIEIFEDDLNHGRNALILLIIGIVCILTYSVSLILVLMGSETTVTGATSFFLIAFGMVFIFINLAYYIFLAYKTISLAPKVTEVKQQRGLKFLGFGGIVIGLIYISRILIMFGSNPETPSMFTTISTSIVD